MHYLCLCVREGRDPGYTALPVRNTILPMACKMENLVEKGDSGCVHFYDYIGSFLHGVHSFCLGFSGTW